MSGAGSESSRESETRRLFDEAAGLSGDARRAVLEAARSRDAELAAEVEALLAHHDAADGLLDRPAAEALSRTAAGETGGESEHALAPGTKIGAYTLIHELGRGGMGVVYEAEQASPRRRVALKLIRAELATRSMLRRFAHEAAALGMLQHPGIAQVFEAGSATLDGQARAYIAMELCAGEPITRWARQRGLSLKDRLLLIAQVCDAVQHAHQRGVIHRDLTPANVLVSGESAADARVKVLDFGIARLTEQETGEGAGAGGGGGATLATSVGQIVGTLGYLSPEQAAGDPARVDSRTDIYSIGVILYELVCGKRPLHAESGSVAEALRRLETEDAEAPSRVAESGAAELRGDVDTIALKALAREPSRRYQSASELAADIRGHLAGEPISARPYTRWELAARAARRNKPWVVGGAAVVLALVGGLTATAWQAVRATRASREADRRAEVALKGGAFLRRMLDAAIPESARESDITVAEMFGAASRDLDADRTLDPEVAATMHKTLADAMLALGDGTAGERHARRSYELRREILGEENPQTLESLSSLAEAIAGQGREEEGLELVRGALERAERVLGPDHEVTIDLTAMYAWAIEEMDLEEGVRVAREAIARAERVFGEGDRRTLLMKSNLGIQLMVNGKSEEALAILRENMGARERWLGRLHPDTLSGLYNYAGALIRAKRAEEAAPIFDDLVVRSRELLGETHPATLYAEFGRGVALQNIGRVEESAEALRALRVKQEKRIGPEAYQTVRTRVALAKACTMLKRYDEAEEALTGCYELDLARNGPDHGGTQDTAKAWAVLEKMRGNQGEAMRWAVKGGLRPPAESPQSAEP